MEIAIVIVAFVVGVCVGGLIGLHYADRIVKDLKAILQGHEK